MNSIKKKRDEGFTIIEVLIVLAIAGLIILIVFLAVPALQRNSRNTQRKNDVAGILGAVNEWTSNNSGALPTVAADQTTAVGYAKPGYYDKAAAAGTQGSISWAAGAQGALATTAPNDRVIIVTGAKCGASGATVQGSSRQLAVQYLIETSGGYQSTCQES